MTTSIQIKRSGAVAEVMLDRPEVHNAFDDTLIAALTNGFTDLSEDPDVRVVVLAGAGRSFCAGADLDWMARMVQYTREENVADSRAMQQMFAAIAECSKVTIARVQGAAIGGGVGLVAACDIAIASEEAKFAFSEVRLGLVPAVISPYVIEKIGRGAFRALLLTGERFDAKEAHRLGLLRQVVPAAELNDAVQRCVEQALQAGPQAIAAAKQLLRDMPRLTADEVADATVELIAALRVSPEGQEGIRAFLEKRSPGWTSAKTEAE